MSTAQDSALTLTAQADALSAQANGSMTSAAHFRAQQGHVLATSAWQVINTASAKTAYHNSLAQIHLTTANQLKAAGR